MSDINYQAFYEFTQEQLVKNPTMSIKDLSTDLHSKTSLLPIPTKPSPT